MTVAIVGLGLMGGSFAKGLKKLGAVVIGINRTKEVAEEALLSGVVDSIDRKDWKKAKLIIFCTPIRGTAEFIKEHVQEFHPEAVLTDIAGVKGDMAEYVREMIPPSMDFISTHPMCGREGAGFSQSKSEIFQGANFLIIPHEKNKAEHIDMIRRLALELGASHVTEVTAEEHDRRIAYTSDLPHVIAAALVNSRSMTEETKYFIGGSFRDETRVADINSILWTDLFLENRENLLEEIDRFSQSLSEFRKALKEKDEASLKEQLEKAGKRKRSLSREEK